MLVSRNKPQMNQYANNMHFYLMNQQEVEDLRWQRKQAERGKRKREEPRKRGEERVGNKERREKEARREGEVWINKEKKLKRPRVGVKG